MIDVPLCHADFLRHVGTDFVIVDADAADTVLQLAAATSLPPSPGGARFRVPFSLLFRSAGHDILPQRLYRFRHGGMGEIDMFIVPIGRDASGVTYEAAFG